MLKIAQHFLKTSSKSFLVGGKIIKNGSTSLKIICRKQLRIAQHCTDHSPLECRAYIQRQVSSKCQSRTAVVLSREWLLRDFSGGKLWAVKGGLESVGAPCPGFRGRNARGHRNIVAPRKCRRECKDCSAACCRSLPTHGPSFPHSGRS